jgi:hypothetical protein
MIEYLTVPEYKGMAIVIEEHIRVQCSISLDKLHLHIKLEYNIIEKQFELESLRRFLRSFKSETIESVCFKIKKQLEMDVDHLRVTVTGRSRHHPCCTAML